MANKNKPSSAQSVEGVEIYSKKYNAAELKAIRASFAPGSTDDDFQNFIREAEERNLIPGRHVYFQLRKAKLYDASSGTYYYGNKATYVTSIDSFRLNAQRTGKYRGQDQATYIYIDTKTGEPSIRSTVPLTVEGSTKTPRQPWAVEVGVHRSDFDQPLKVVARFDAYAVYYRKDNKQLLTEMWEKRGPEMLAKCAEALALRQAFPEELGGLYINEEIKDDVENNQTPEEPKQSALVAEEPKVVETLSPDNTPAEGTDKPRPGEKKRGRKPKQQPEETSVDNKKVEENLKKTGNIHGLDVSDADLPDFDKPASVQEDDPFLEDEEDSFDKLQPLDEEPNKEERTEYSSRLRAFGLDSMKLRQFILKTSGAVDIKKLTRRQWSVVFDKLDAANKKGKESLNTLITQ